MNELLRYKLSKRTAKELKKIRQSDKSFYAKVEQAIYSLRENPFIGDI